MLVVDDDRVLTRAITRALGAAYAITAENRAPAALERLRGGERFDLILCDVMMPELSGIAIHAELVQVAPDQAARMVFMTGGAFTIAAREFLARVPNPRIEKPFGPPQLRTLVADSLRAARTSP
ncbi:MAG: response regulator [Deltaproteobacteria bacterium]|nr:response regulator [Deltaproteobacteria bacterium]